MSRIISKLNLNKTPQLVESNSMIFAKNIKLLKDGSLGQDDSLVNILNLNTDSIEGIDHLENYRIVGIIPYNTKFYLFLYNQVDSAIVEYDEYNNTYTKCDCNWNYSGGIIDGNCIVSLNGDIILNIAEYSENDDLFVPIKSINLGTGKSSVTDDESIYTQIPKVPFLNLSFVEYYNNNIPNGTYQFFIRYEIRDNFYTNWFPASKELFAGTIKTTRTQQGALQYVDDTIDSGVSFHFQVKTLYNNNLNFKSFQIGFICANNDTTYARAWKKFDLNTTDIYFDYNKEYIEEIEIEDLLASPYGLFNVKNLTNFKNKLYVSNYIETDFNPDLQDYVSHVIVQAVIKSHSTQNNSYYTYPITVQTQGSNKYIVNIDGISVEDIVNNLISQSTNYVDVGNYYIKNYADKGVTLTITKTQYDSYNPDPQNPKYTFIYGINLDDKIQANDYQTIINYIKTHNTAIGQNGRFYISVPTDPNSNYLAVSELVVATTSRVIRYTIRFQINPNALHFDSQPIKVDTTLMPGQEYDYYIHFVKDTGEYTNGYKIGTTFIDITNRNHINVSATSQQILNALANHDIFYPVFIFNSLLPTGYIGCFITISHTKHNISEIFNVHNTGINNLVLGDNLDLDIREYKDFEDLTYIRPGQNFEGKCSYFASQDNTNWNTFGGSGKVQSTSGNFVDGSQYFIKFPYESNAKYIELKRITPYIIFDTPYYRYDNQEDLLLYSYICTVRKLDDNLVNYIAGTDVYKKATSFSTGSNTLEELTENEFKDWMQVVGNLPDVEVIYSNFNLNYLTITLDLNPSIISKSFDTNGIHASTNDPTNNVIRGLVIALNSINLSDIYELKAMYKSYTRKTYQIYSDTAIIKFDNTVRSSVLEGDESVINIFKFKATDYYNVPTDKGIIINLKAVGEAIIVHTQDSLYKFTGSNSLMAAGGEDVAMKEGEPFDTGIQEIFGSRYGFAGLQHKHQHILSENGYSFYDSDANVIYLFNGQQQMNSISDDINKLLHHKPIKDIQFASDYYNDRFFIEITFSDDSFTNLTFNFKSKSFISIHDFKFDNSFNTKTKCYFIKKDANNEQKEIYVVKDEASRSYNGLAEEEDIYPTKEGFTFNGDTYVSNVENASIVDIILSEDYANVKTLNAISWVCNLINGFSNTDDVKSKFVAEESLTPYPGAFVRIYTDSTSTALVDIHKASNPYSISITESYKYPRYNLGQWTLNYFRNILNTNDITRSGSPADQQSLIYGKYIVIRFVFSNEDNFKLEDVNYNIAPYNR